MTGIVGRAGRGVMVGLLIVGACLALLVWGLAAMFWMPGTSPSGPLPPLTDTEAALADALRADVKALAAGIGERNAGRYEALQAAADYIDASFEAAGYVVSRQRYVMDGRPYDNIEVERRGVAQADEVIVVGAHYDTVPGSPGADDNATGVAATLALARAFAGLDLQRTVRFVAFVNEEAPYAHTARMGSVVYTARARERGERVAAMLSLETMGSFADEPGSQRYPSVLRWIYPDAGNFIAFVSNLPSRRLLKDAVEIFRRHASVPSEGGALLERLPGVGWSDHWAFWRQGYPAIMVTDTAPFRYAAYHSAQDTPDKVDFGRLARVVAGLEHVVAGLGGARTRTPSRDRVDVRTDGLHPADRSM